METPDPPSEYADSTILRFLFANLRAEEVACSNFQSRKISKRIPVGVRFDELRGKGGWVNPSERIPIPQTIPIALPRSPRVASIPRRRSRRG